MAIYLHLSIIYPNQKQRLHQLLLSQPCNVMANNLFIKQINGGILLSLPSGGH